MQELPVDAEPAPPTDAWVPPEPEFVDIPADLPVLEPSVTITLPLNEQITSAVVVPNEHNGTDVLYVAVTQERVNVWAAVVYFVPEIALGLTALLIIVALRKLWVGRRFLHRQGEAYCKKCWAGLTGVESATCPECGRAVAKTKRVAKRPRRSPLSPRCAWAAAALLATFGSAVIWFGEGWYDAIRFGFDLRDPYIRRDLRNYADRDSVFRINPMAGWFEWHSAKLAAFGRDNDQAWIESIEHCYPIGQQIHYHLIVRRYATNDGQRLGSYPLPDSAPFQNNTSFTGIGIGQANSTVIAKDEDWFYRLDIQSDEPWRILEDQTPDSMVTVAGVTSDGSYMVIGFGTNGPFRYTAASSERIVAFDCESGDPTATLSFVRGIEEEVGVIENAPLSPSDMLTLNLTGGSFVAGIGMIDGESQVLIYVMNPEAEVSNRLFVWDFTYDTLFPFTSESSMPFPVDRVEVGPYRWTARSITTFDDTYSDYNRMIDLLTTDERFRLWVAMSKRSGKTIGWLPVGRDVSWGSTGIEPPPYDQYDPITCLPLYDFDHARLHTQPSRVLEFNHPRGQEPISAVLAPSGQYGVIQVGLNGPVVIIDVERAEALAYPMRHIDSRLQMETFVNDEHQLLRWVANRTQGSIPLSREEQHQVLIFDLPE